MRPHLLLFLFLSATFRLFGQDSLNMTRLARWDDDNLPIASPGNLNLQYSGCWGMTVNKREIAVIGGALHVLFFDITIPTQPKLIGKFAGNQNTVWREFKSYRNRMYAVSDATSEGLMIFDLSQAPDTIVRTYFSNALFNSAHTITLDTVSGRIYLNGSNASIQGVVVLDVKTNPDKPALLAAPSLPGGYVHDSYVRRDTLYASSGNSGLWIYDFTTPAAPKTLATAGTGGYNHNNWPTLDGRYTYYTEEIPAGRPVRIVDLSELSQGSIEPVGGFLDNLLDTAAAIKSAIPHNVFIKDNLLFNSQYEDGIMVYDISNPLKPKLFSYYDTHPENTQYNSYFGNWGNYPWLPSGNIISSDMQNGLQITRIQKLTPVQQPESPELEVRVSPNPAHTYTRLLLPETGCSYRLYSASGVLVNEKEMGDNLEVRLETGNLPAGLYVLEVWNAAGKHRICKLTVL